MVEKLSLTDFFLSGKNYVGVFSYFCNFEISEKCIKFPLRFLCYLKVINAKVGKQEEKEASLENVLMTNYEDPVAERSENVLSYEAEDIKLMFDLESSADSVL